MNLRDLRYLVALADERHFGKAAERCFVSQPTLSAQVRKLEDYLGVPLVERQPKRVALTPTGAKVVQRARVLLQEADAIVELAKTDRDPLSGPLKLALIPTVGPYLLPHVAAKLRRELPRLKLMLYEYQTEPLLERLRAGEIDMGIVALPVDLGRQRGLTHVATFGRLAEMSLVGERDEVAEVAEVHGTIIAPAYRDSQNHQAFE